MKYKEIIEQELKKYFDYEKYNLPVHFPKKIIDAMAYTTLLGGKRLRGILCLESCKIASGDYKMALPVSCAYEMLHAQSLIHDDLPSMDNDDLRRGKPSNHKIFGEAVAILAGDALISLGGEIILESDLKRKDEILLHYLQSAGAFGIVGGQTLDILSEGQDIDFETLKTIHQYKTGALFRGAILSGALAGGADDKTLKILDNFSQKFGLSFQILDDILDEISTTSDMGKTTGKDKNAKKATYVTHFGLDEAKNILNKTIQESYDIINKSDIKSEVFEEILDSMINKIRD